jgi:cystathionine beta-synthase
MASPHPPSSASGSIGRTRALWWPTPLLEVTLPGVTPGVRLAAKFEAANPTASVKDRIARWMVDAAEDAGDLEPGGTIVESSSGNTGIALAAIGADRGYRVIIVCKTTVPPEKVSLLRMLGAEVRQVEGADLGTDDHYLALCTRIARDEGGVFLNQYENDANPRAHFESTGPEIWEQSGHAVDVFVAGGGTGGTITGTARYLREHNPAVTVVLADPVGSIYAHAHATGELSDPVPYAVEAVGQAERMIPGNIDFEAIDRVVSVPDADSFIAMRMVAERQGILCGPSGGLALAASLVVAADASPGTHIVTLLPDAADRYLSRGVR